MMACKAAVKAGDPLTADEIAALLARREIAERSSHCPPRPPDHVAPDTCATWNGNSSGGSDVRHQGAPNGIGDF